MLEEFNALNVSLEMMIRLFWPYIVQMESSTLRVLKLLLEVTEKMWLLPDIIRVTSLANYSWVHAEEDDILVDPFLPDDIPLTQELLDERKSIALSHEDSRLSRE